MNSDRKFEVRIEKEARGNILYFIGELDLSMAADVRACTDGVLHNTQQPLILNLERLTYIDSTGIGIIISILKSRDANQASFRVEHIPPGILRLFDITGITKFLAPGTPC